MKILKLICILLIFNSCSCDWYAKKAQKCGVTSTEVVTFHDTIYTKLVQSDTVFKYFVKDSVIVREGKLVMKYFYNSHDSTVYLKGKCESDTVIKEIKIPYEKTVIKVDYFPKWIWWVLGLLIISAIVFRILK